jgi:hypothetical protein
MIDRKCKTTEMVLGEGDPADASLADNTNSRALGPYVSPENSAANNPGNDDLAVLLTIFFREHNRPLQGPTKQRALTGPSASSAHSANSNRTSDTPVTYPIASTMELLASSQDDPKHNSFNELETGRNAARANSIDDAGAASPRLKSSRASKKPLGARKPKLSKYKRSEIRLVTPAVMLLLAATAMAVWPTPELKGPVEAPLFTHASSALDVVPPSLTRGSKASKPVPTSRTQAYSLMPPIAPATATATGEIATRATTQPAAALNNALGTTEAPSSRQHLQPTAPTALLSEASKVTAAIVDLKSRTSPEPPVVVALSPMPAELAVAEPPSEPPPQASQSNVTSDKSTSSAELLDEGWQSFKTGDVERARVLFEQAADQGNMAAAIALGNSYDPKSLAAAGISTPEPDAMKAIYWYKKAHRLAAAARRR